MRDMYTWQGTLRFNPKRIYTRSLCVTEKDEHTGAQTQKLMVVHAERNMNHVDPQPFGFLAVHSLHTAIHCCQSQSPTNRGLGHCTHGVCDLLQLDMLWIEGLRIQGCRILGFRFTGSTKKALPTVLCNG